MKIMICTLGVLAVLAACNRNETYNETYKMDIYLLELLANEQLKRNNTLVNSMRAQLENYGYPVNESDYYNNSVEIVRLRNTLMGDDNFGITTFSDTVDYLHDSYINSGHYHMAQVYWNESMERMKEVYKRSLEENFDSLIYFKFFLATLRKEEGLHLYNAQMMAH